ncbi:MAG: hypothetical protein WBM40_20555 [Thiohalocapsa sp.]
MFIFVDWAIGYTLKQGMDWVKGSVLFRKDLVEALNSTAEKWNDELPKKFRIENPETLFKPVPNENLSGRPRLRELRETLQDGEIPDPEVWAQAALEHVRFVHLKLDAPESDIWMKAVFGSIQSTARRMLAADASPLYEAEEGEIMPYLQDLGRRLTLTIMQDEKTTLPLMYRQLQRIEAKLDRLPGVSDGGGE